MAKAAVLLPRREMQQMAAELIAHYPNLLLSIPTPMPLVNARYGYKMMAAS